MDPREDAHRYDQVDSVEMNKHPAVALGTNSQPEITRDGGDMPADAQPSNPTAVPDSITNSSAETDTSLEHDPVGAPKVAGSCLVQEEVPRSATWHPSVLRLAPLAGILAVLLAVFLLLASFAILAASDDVNILTWQFAPNVYLAIFTAISNKAIAFALLQGAIVSFWLKAIRGTTLGQLQRDWGYSLYVYKAIISGRFFNLLAFACICATFVAVDGPLLQRASTVHSKSAGEDVILQAHIAQELPGYKTGYFMPHDNGSFYLGSNKAFDQVIKHFDLARPLHAIKGCPGTCEATILGPALAPQGCSSSLVYVNFSEPLTREEKATFNSGYGPVSPDRYVFAVAVYIKPGETEQLRIDTIIPSSPGNSTCAAWVNTTECRYVSGIAEYSVTIQDDIVKIAMPQSHPNIVRLANNTAQKGRPELDLGYNQSYGNLHASTLGGIAYAGNLKFNSREALLPWFGSMLSFSPYTDPPNMFTFQNTIVKSAPNHCVGSFSDPRDEITAFLNELMFRAGVHYASMSAPEIESAFDEGVEVVSNVTGVITSQINVFKTDWSYFGGAVAVELLAICAVLATFWGWWNLGREFNLSPLEIGKAFDAPLLRDLSCDSNSRDITRLEGQREIQYGVVKAEFVFASNPAPGHVEEKIAFADQLRVHKLQGERLGLSQSVSILTAKRRQRRRGVRFSREDPA